MAKTKVFLLAIQVLVTLGAVACCNEYQLQRCIESFTSSVGTTPIVSERRLTVVCESYYPTLHTCLSSYSVGCSMKEKSLFQVITNTYDYVCGEGKLDTIRYSACLAKPSVVSNTKSCESTVKYKLEYGGASKCGEAMTEFLDCVTRDVQAECGWGAAKYEEKLAHLALKPLLDTIGCDFSAPDSHNGKDTRSGKASEKGTGSGSASVSAMMWIVGVALIAQRLVR